MVDRETNKYLAELIQNKSHNDYLMEYIFDTNEYGDIYIKKDLSSILVKLK